MKLFGFILNTAKRVKTLKANADLLLNSNAAYLENGVWLSDGTNTVLFNKKSRDRSKSESLNINGINFKRHDVDRSTRMAYAIHKRFYRLKCNNHGNSGFTGNTVIVSTNGKVLRIVDYKKSLMLTKYDSIERLKNNNLNRERFAVCFNTVPLYECNYDELYTVEKYIIRKKADRYQLFEHILDDYAKFSENAEYTVSGKGLDESLVSGINDLLKALDMQDTRARLLDLLKNRYIKTLSHCDMNDNNVVYDGAEYYYIDFECVDERYPLYDILQFLFYSKIEGKKPELSDYLKGDFDEKISEILSNYGVVFNGRDRKLYLLIFLLETTGFDIAKLKECGWLFEV